MLTLPFGPTTSRTIIIGGHNFTLLQLQCFIFQHGMSLLQQMQHNSKLHNFLSLFSNNTICNLGNNRFTIARSKQFFILGMPWNLWIIPIPFLHINRNILFNLFMMCMLTEKIPFKKHQIIFFFHLTTNSTFDSVQIAIWPYI